MNRALSEQNELLLILLLPNEYLIKCCEQNNHQLVFFPKLNVNTVTIVINESTSMNEHFYTSNVRWITFYIFSCLSHINGIRALRFISFCVITQYSKPLLGSPGRQLRNIELPSETRHVLSMRSVTSGTIVLPVEKCNMCMYKVFEAWNQIEYHVYIGNNMYDYDWKTL